MRSLLSLFGFRELIEVILMAAEQIDEIALLGCDLGGDSSYIGEINEDELLGLNESAVCSLVELVSISKLLEPGKE